MGFANDVQSLQDRADSDLELALGYYTDSQIVWRLVYKLDGAGHQVTFRNAKTGVITTLADLAKKSRRYVTEELAEATFQQFISIFENWYFDLLRLWLTAYPQSLGKKTVDFASILELADKDAVTQLVVGKELNEVLYKRPAEWFAYLEDKVQLGCPSAAEIENIAEAKASRDVLVHNKGVANKAYLAKAGGLARFQVGEKMDTPANYHRATWELVRKIIGDVSQAAIAKLS